MWQRQTQTIDEGKKKKKKHWRKFETILTKFDDSSVNIMYLHKKIKSSLKIFVFGYIDSYEIADTKLVNRCC